MRMGWKVEGNSMEFVDKDVVDMSCRITCSEVSVVREPWCSTNSLGLTITHHCYHLLVL